MNSPQNYGRNLQKDARSAAHTVRQGAEQAVSDAAGHVRRAAGDISDTAEMTYEQLKDQVATLKSDMAKLATSAGEASYDYVGGQVGDAMSRAEKLTRERPAAAWGIAVGVGFVLAHLLSRRRR